jgi:hypothetical protein
VSLRISPPQFQGWSGVWLSISKTYFLMASLKASASSDFSVRRWQFGQTAVTFIGWSAPPWDTGVKWWTSRYGTEFLVLNGAGWKQPSHTPLERSSAYVLIKLLRFLICVSPLETGTFRVASEYALDRSISKLLSCEEVSNSTKLYLRSPFGIANTWTTEE